MNDNKHGLMKPTTKPNDLITNMRKAFGPASSTPQSLEQKLQSLTETELNLVLNTAQMVKLIAQMDAGQSRSYRQIVQGSYPNMRSNLQSLIAEVLQDADPLPDVPIITPQEPKRSADEIAFSLYDRPEYQVSPQQTVSEADEKTVSALQSALAETLAKQTEQPSGPTGNDAFLARLTQSESSGNSQAEITIKDGRRFVGSLQFGSARLSDFKKHSGKRFTQDEFKADEALQAEVADWHVADINKSIDALGDAAKDYDRDGLRSVAHLGGKGGMRKFVKSGGKHNPADELGTSLRDYYDKFSSKT